MKLFYSLTLACAVWISPNFAGAQYVRPDGLPDKLFQGCENTEQKFPQRQGSDESPRKRIVRAKDNTDVITERVFASVSLDVLNTVSDDDLKNHCWFRLDGVWVERNSRPNFDTSFETDIWGEDEESQEGKGLFHGVYTRPDYLIIEPSDNPNNALTLMRPFYGERPIVFTAQDEIDLKDVLKLSGKTKTYSVRNGNVPGGLAPDMDIRVTNNGFVMLEVGDQEFIRPQPALSKAQRDAQIADSDAFNRESTIQFLDVTLRGYDVTTQNPNRFHDNDKGRVFKLPKPTDYYVKDKQIIPIDMALDLRTDQANVSISFLQSSASEIQKAYSASFGQSTSIGLSGSAGSEKKKGDKGSSKSVNLEASYGWGSSYSNEQFSSMKRSQSVSQALGFSRQKRYALIRNHAFSTLDGFFQDAIYTAFERGDFEPVVRRYGTHYTYATTFGSAGTLRHLTSKQGYQSLTSQTKSHESSENAQVLIVNHRKNSSSSSRTGASFREDTEYGTAFFDAVGGNGSWNESGFSAGPTPYPILMDMRPLDELLNPMNFPGQPEIYETARRELADVIDAHILEAAQTLSQEDIRPDTTNQPQKWQFVARGLKCFSSGTDEGLGNPVQIKGIVNIRFPGTGKKQMKAWDSKYPEYKDHAVNMQCSSKNPKASNTETRDERGIMFTGTPEELKNMRYQLHVHLQEVDWGADAWDGIEIIRRTPTAVFPFPTGSSKDIGEPIVQDVEIHAGANYPQLKFAVEFTRLE